MLTPGTLINHEYLVEALIGKGGMGSIYKARLVTPDADEAPAEYYALKEIPLFVRNAAGQMVKQNIAPQIDIMRRIQHPGIARVVDVFYFEDALYLASEYIEGQSLLSRSMPKDPSRLNRLYLGASSCVVCCLTCMSFALRWFIAT